MMETVIVIGGNSGIGKAIVNLLSNRYKDINIIIVDKKIEKYKKNANSEYYKMDLGDKNEVEKFLEYIKIKKFNVKSLINSAGYQENINVLNISQEEWNRMFDVTLNSIVRIEQDIAKNMLNNKLLNKTIINITSIHSNIIREIAHYSSSKAALEMFSKELAYELSKFDIRVNCIAPGSIDTPLLRKDLDTEQKMFEASSQIPIKRHGKPSEVAELVDFLFSEKSKYILGTTITIDGGLSLVI